jgi:N-acetylmuramoyl-L-alanine amidase
VNRQNLSDISRIVLHHSASPRATTTAADILAWHTDPRRVDGPFDTIGYHFVIEGDGALRYGRPLDKVPAAQKGANLKTIAVCIVGNNLIDDEVWTDAQLISGHSLIVMLRSVLGRRLPFCGHRDLAASDCPGVDVRDVFRELV